MIKMRHEKEWSISDVVVLPKLRGSLDRRKGTSPQLRGRAYDDSHDGYPIEEIGEWMNVLQCIKDVLVLLKKGKKKSF